MSNTNELKPCPFCGGVAQLIEVKDEILFNGIYEVSCKHCGAKTFAFYKDRTLAVEAWNKRVKV